MKLASRVFRRMFQMSARSTGPPKIFGIGLPKTATTSLHFALERLGFRSVHASTMLCEAINKEASDYRPLLSALEHDFDAFVDWPISYLYAALDRRFPASKFILTVRDPVARYRAAIRHVAADRVRRDSGLSYGWVSLESPSMFVIEDARHTSLVLSYFKGRSKDFLLMRIADGDGWIPLCTFLGVSVPTDPFPHHRTSASYVSEYARLSPVEPRWVNGNLDAWARAFPVTGR